MLNDDQVRETLRSVGMTCFVKYLRLFGNSSLSAEEVARRLVRREGWAEASTLHRRVRGARRIIDAGRTRDALMLIKESEKLRHLRKEVDDLLEAF